MRLDALRHLEPLRVAGLLAELLRHPPQVRRARILRAIHAMAEPGDLLLARELAAHVGVDALGARVLSELEQHLHHFGVGAAVQRPFERADPRHDRRVHVGERRGRDPRRERRRVQLVIRVQDQRDVHRADRRSGSAAARSAGRESWPRVPSPDPAAIDAAALLHAAPGGDQAGDLRGEPNRLAIGRLLRVVARIRIVVTRAPTSACAARPCRLTAAACSSAG